MSDVLFRYLLATGGGEAPAIERVIRTAAVHLEVLSQHHAMTVGPMSCPQSQHRRITFVDMAIPTVPTFERPLSCVERFPLRDTLELAPCQPCRGTGVLACTSCRGSGLLLCTGCSGLGQVPARGGTGPCRSCSGTGGIGCTDCRSTGGAPHDRCDGEGRLAHWKEEVHTWTVEKHEESILPPQASSSLEEAVREWLQRHPEPAPLPLEESAPALVRDPTPELAVVLERAALRSAALVRHSGAGRRTRVFEGLRCRVVPMSTVVTRSGAREGCDFWLIGRGDDAIEEVPHRSFTEKMGRWAGALRHRSGHVRTIAVASGACPKFLPMLAAIGSFVGALETLDGNYASKIRSMLGEAGAASERITTLLVQPQGAPPVRLVEVSDPGGMTQAEWERMAQVCHGLLAIEERGAPPLSLPQAASHPQPVAGCLPVDSASQTCNAHGLTPDGALAIEAVRRSFLRNIPGDDLTWPSVFAHLWEPIATILRAPHRG